MNNQRNQNNNSLQTLLLFVAVLMLGYLIYTMGGGAPVVYRAPVQQPETGSIIIQEQPAVIIATGAPPSVPVVAPAATATSAPTAVPTHPPLPGSMQEAHEMGYWPMPITPAQYEECVIDPSVNPACQFYAGGER